MDSAWSRLCNGPRSNIVQRFGKKLWPLFCILIANGFSLVSASQRAKKEFRATLWQKVVTSFLYFGCQCAPDFVGEGKARGRCSGRTLGLILERPISASLGALLGSDGVMHVTSGRSWVTSIRKARPNWMEIYCRMVEL